MSGAFCSRESGVEEDRKLIERRPGEVPDVVVTLDGSVSPFELATLVASLESGGCVDASSLLLVDQRALDCSAVASAEITALARRLGTVAAPAQGAALAVVVRDAVGFGVARMLYARLPESFETQVFYSPDEACAWLIGLADSKRGAAD
jgi:hypothetical protein